jgi:hypothetical protein
VARVSCCAQCCRSTCPELAPSPSSHRRRRGSNHAHREQGFSMTSGSTHCARDESAVAGGFGKESRREARRRECLRVQSPGQMTKTPSRAPRAPRTPRAPRARYMEHVGFLPPIFLTSNTRAPVGVQPRDTQEEACWEEVELPPAYPLASALPAPDNLTSAPGGALALCSAAASTGPDRPPTILQSLVMSDSTPAKSVTGPEASMGTRLLEEAYSC